MQFFSEAIYVMDWLMHNLTVTSVWNTEETLDLIILDCINKVMAWVIN